jgi:FkbM family methyltransferase
MLIDFRQLFPRYNINPKGVLHVGANVGEEAPVYLELGIKRQHWIEANDQIFQKLVANISNNPEATAQNICIGDTTDELVIFHISNNGSQSSSILELGTHKTAHPEVHYVEEVEMRTVRIDMIVPELTNGLDFLNIDLQGAELKALRGMGELLNQFKWVYLEVNWEELYVGCALFPEVCDFMQSKGFKVAEYKKCGGTGWGDCLFIR